MNRFLEQHQNKIVTGMILLGVVALIWLDDRRSHAIAGKPSPAISFRMLDGNQTVTLESLRGQPTVLDFWATWCGPCRASLPHIDELARRYQGRAHVIAVNADSEDPALQMETRSHLHLTLPIAADGQPAAAEYNVDSLPTTVILDRDGKVVDSFVGSSMESAIERTLERLL